MARSSQPISPHAIVCRNVRTHNLKGVDIEFPHNQWTAVTGVSGSGKSSLVFDTVYAESQRRFLETLGTYERQFLQGLPQGEADLVENTPPAIALKQSNRTSDPRSVVGTAADIVEPLRTVFVALMPPSCASCGNPVQQSRMEDVRAYVEAQKNGALLGVDFKLPSASAERKKLFQNLLLEGYLRLVSDGEIISLEEAFQHKLPEDVLIALDRMDGVMDADERHNRLEAAWSQIRFSPRFSTLRVFSLDKEGAIKSNPKDFYVQPWCDTCQKMTRVIQNSDLDWTSVLGACGTCHGIGNVPSLDEHKIIPNPLASLKEGAVKPWTTQTWGWCQDELLATCKLAGIPVGKPWKDLKPEDRFHIWEGDPERKTSKDFTSIKSFFKRLEEDKYKTHQRVLVAKYRRYTPCPECAGARIGAFGRNATCGGVRYADILQWELKGVATWCEKVASEKAYAHRLKAIREEFQEVQRKVETLVKLGLGSTSLGRRCRTLSGGEYQRVLLTRVIGNGLTDTLYILDEPSVGLGKSEIPSLIDAIRQLRDLGNTVLMVEHDTTLIEAADAWVEMGPGGGREGGLVVGASPKKPPANGSKMWPVSFAPKDKFNRKKPERKKISGNDCVMDPNHTLQLHGFCHQNCKNLTVEIPLGRLSVITGPSGAGKSTLLEAGISAALEKWWETDDTQSLEEDADARRGRWSQLVMPGDLKTTHELVAMEQKAMHRTITSVPATLLGLMDSFRRFFAATPEAREAGLTPADFSFNGAGGCVQCEGKGILQEDLFFLGEVEKVCPECQGSRYRPDVLKVKWNGRNIAQWLECSLEEARAALKAQASLARVLHLAERLGIGYLPLGIPTTRISGGEAQRLRICATLSRSAGRLICLLDEPTRGLSERDAAELLQTLLELCENEEHTFVVVEHHDMFVHYAHHLMTLGPGSGVLGGRMTAREVVPSLVFPKKG